MVKLAASGEIFSLNASTGFKEGIVKGNVGGEIRAFFDTNAELCHGLDLSANAKILAQAQAALSAIIGIDATANASASAGINSTIKISPDIFDELGLTVDIQAYAQAAAAIRLALSLDFETLAATAKQNLSGLEYELFITFINEIKLEAGVWGKASFSASIGGYLKVNGSLRKTHNTKPGFIVAAGFDVGWSAGTGWDFYAGMTFENPKRFFMSSIEIVTAKIVEEASNLMDEDITDTLELTGFFTPILFEIAYDLGQIAQESSQLSSDDKASFIVNIFYKNLQNYLLDKLISLSEELLHQMIDEVINIILSEFFEKEALEELQERVRNLINLLNNSTLNIEALPELFTSILSIVEIMGKPYLEKSKKELTFMWTAMATAFAIANTVEKTSASVNFFNNTASADIDEVLLPDHRDVDILEEEFTAFFGPQNTQDGISLEEGIDYLIDYLTNQLGINKLFENSEGTLYLFETISTSLDISLGEIITSGLQAEIEKNIANTKIYKKLKALIRDTWETYIKDDVIQMIRENSGDRSDITLYIDEVIEPCVDIINNFLFEKLDDFVEGKNHDELFNNGFSESLSIVVYQVFTRNVVTITDIILFEHAIPNLNSTFTQLGVDIRNNKLNSFIDLYIDLVKSASPLMMAGRNELKKSTQIFVSKLMDAAAQATGPKIWTDNRRNEFRKLTTDILLSIGGDITSSNMSSKFKDLSNCFYIPNSDSLEKLSVLCLSILADEARVIFERVTPALFDYSLSLIGSSIDGFIAAVNEFFKGFEGVLEQLEKEHEKFRANLSYYEEEIRKIARKESRNLREMKNFLNSKKRQDEILLRVRRESVAQIKKNVSSFPGFDLQPAFIQKEQLKVAVGVFYNVTWPVHREFLKAGMHILSSIAGGVADIIDASLDLSDFMKKSAREIEKNVRKSLGGIKLEIPTDQLIDIADDIFLNNVSFKRKAKKAISYKEQKKKNIKGKNRAEKNKNIYKSKIDSKEKQKRLLAGNRIAIKINSPTDGIFYKKNINISISIKGANKTFVSDTKRLLVFINHYEVSVTPTYWKYSRGTDTLSLNITLAGDKIPGIKNGGNFLRVCVLNKSGIEKSEQKIFSYTSK